MGTHFKFLSSSFHVVKKGCEGREKMEMVTAKLGQTFCVFGFPINCTINGWMFASFGAAAVLPSC